MSVYCEDERGEEIGVGDGLSVIYSDDTGCKDRHRNDKKYLTMQRGSCVS